MSSPPPALGCRFCLQHFCYFWCCFDSVRKLATDNWTRPEQFSQSNKTGNDCVINGSCSTRLVFYAMSTWHSQNVVRIDPFRSTVFVLFLSLRWHITTWKLIKYFSVHYMTPTNTKIEIDESKRSGVKIGKRI